MPPLSNGSPSAIEVSIPSFDSKARRLLLCPSAIVPLLRFPGFDFDFLGVFGASKKAKVGEISGAVGVISFSSNFTFVCCDVSVASNSLYWSVKCLRFLGLKRQSDPMHSQTSGSHTRSLQRGPSSSPVIILPTQDEDAAKKANMAEAIWL